MTNKNVDTSVHFAYVRIKNIENDSLIKLLTGIDGFVDVDLKAGKYNVSVTATGFDKFSFDINILEKEAVNLNVQLGLGPELTVYQINAKMELKEEEIINIMKCVKQNRKDFYKNCSDRKKFYVLMHI